MTSIRHNHEPEPLSPADESYLDAAREAILAVGWSRTTLTDIARRAGVSRMTLYRRWPDTRTLLADLMTREWGRTVGAAVLDVDADAATLISSTVVATVHALRDNALLRRIVEVDPDVLLPYLLERRGRSQEQVAEVLATAIREGQRAGTVRRGDASRMARSLVLACHGFVLSAQTMLEDPEDRAGLRALDRELARLVDGYLAP